MAKRDYYSSSGKSMWSSRAMGREAGATRNSKISSEVRKRNERKDGPRERILNAYRKNGYNGAVNELKLINNGRNIYSIEIMEKWISEYEKNKEYMNNPHGQTGGGEDIGDRWN